MSMVFIQLKIYTKDADNITFTHPEFENHIQQKN